MHARWNARPHLRRSHRTSRPGRPQWKHVGTSSPGCSEVSSLLATSGYDSGIQSTGSSVGSGKNGYNHRTHVQYCMHGKQVVKVIWHKATTPPHTDGSTAFARWRQYPPHPTHTSLGPPHPKQQQHLDRFIRFCTAPGRDPILYNGPCLSPSKIGHPQGGPGPHLTHGSLGPSKSTHTPNSILIGLAIFAGLTIVTQRDRQRTDRQTRSVCSNRPHIRSTVTQSKITLPQNMLLYPHIEMTLLNQLPKNPFLSPLVPENNLWASAVLVAWLQYFFICYWTSLPLRRLSNTSVNQLHIMVTLSFAKTKVLDFSLRPNLNLNGYSLVFNWL